LAKRFKVVIRASRSPVVVGVVELHVGDQTQLGPEFHQGTIGFIGFRHQQSPAPVATVAAEGGHHATDHGGGIAIGGRQQGGDQRAGGGLAMAARHRNRGLAIDQGGQHIGAVADR
jgi:hypothetical protein